MSPESPTTPCERLTQHERQLSIDSSCTGVATSRGAPSVPPAYYATKLRRGDEDSRSVCSLNGSRRTLASCAAPRSLTASKNCLRQLSSEANYGNFNDSSSLPGELSRIARNCCPIETVKPARLHDVLVSRLEQKQRMQQLAATSSRNGSQRCLHSHHQQQVPDRVTHCSETRDNSSSESEPSPVRQEQQPLLVVQDADVPRSNRPILQLQMPAPPCMLPTSV
ncbi:hypothetical protein QAD02_006007 [Eretmocerus hayati]|uniref:Uncharacterized protein n=1 Tax=Eretmocerus hayati TaxID=131215 RepID=A0ACC2MZW0_9HYME|nr:hypothetical protein QAD02_006007 [Eretmocerus hayati]